MGASDEMPGIVEIDLLFSHWINPHYFQMIFSFLKHIQVGLLYCFVGLQLRHIPTCSFSQNKLVIQRKKKAQSLKQET